MLMEPLILLSGPFLAAFTGIFSNSLKLFLEPGSQRIAGKGGPDQIGYGCHFLGKTHKRRGRPDPFVALLFTAGSL